MASFTDKTPGIYTITNIINNRIYVGLATDIKRRIKYHKVALKANRHNNEYLQRAWNKYGPNTFKFEILVDCPEELLASEEHYWAITLKTHDRKFGYNILPTHPYNRPLLTEEIKKKISLKNKGKQHTSEAKAKITAALLTPERRALSREAQKKMVLANKGKKKNL